MVKRLESFKGMSIDYVGGDKDLTKIMLNKGKVLIKLSSLVDIKNEISMGSELKHVDIYDREKPALMVFEDIKGNKLSFNFHGESVNILESVSEFHVNPSNQYLHGYFDLSYVKNDEYTKLYDGFKVFIEERFSEYHEGKIILGDVVIEFKDALSSYCDEEQLGAVIKYLYFTNNERAHGGKVLITYFLDKNLKMISRIVYDGAMKIDEKVKNHYVVTKDRSKK